LPHKFVDHSHADAILAVVDQPTADLAVKVFGDEFGYVPYIMPGFKLAKKAFEVFQKNPKVKGLVLLRHGLFTFGESAKESYDIHIAAVSKAVEFIKSHPAVPFTPVKNTKAPPYVTVVQILRGLYYTKSNGTRWLFHLNSKSEVLAFSNSEEVKSWSQRGPCTPDHVIRTKAIPMQILEWPDVDDFPTSEQLRHLTAWLSRVLDDHITNYHKYFHKYNALSKEKKRELDPLPRIIILRGIGIVSAAPQWSAVTVAQEIYAHSIEIIRNAQTIGVYTPASEQDIWDMEYWTLEQAKLGKSTPKPLEGRVAYITGAASGIGRAIAILFAKNGSNLYLVDVNEESLQELRNCLKTMQLSVGIAIETVDVTFEEQVERSFRTCVATFGGVDIVVSNAGKPWQGPIAQSTRQLKESFELNFFAHQYVASAAVRIFLAQNMGSCFRDGETEKTTCHEKDERMGGCLLFNTSKASVNPGPDFGPYAIAKAATLALMKQYALEYGIHNIRSNAVNADRVRTAFFSPKVIAERAKSRNLTPEEYFRSNLLKKEVAVEDVAQIFFNLALAEKTSACTVTVDGGNIEASLR